MSDLGSLRKQNIERNKQLLKKLKLDSLSSSIAAEIKPKPKPKPKAQPKARVNKPLPTRRSRRLAKDPQDEKERKIQEELAANELAAQQRLKESRSLKLTGDFDIKDLLADFKSGNLLSENSILGLTGEKDSKFDFKQEEPEIYSKVSHSLSAIHEIGINSSKDDHTVVSPLEISSLQLHSLTDPSQIKLTPHRITSLLFHPATTDRLAFAGDTNGSLGIWAIDQKIEQDEPMTVLIKPHGRNISRINDVAQRPTHVITASYDGSCRVVDLSKQTVMETISVLDDLGSPLGISDINCPSPNMLYATTLDGLFLKHDVREHPKAVRYRSLLRLHDKKIGGFCVNPSNETQIATSSLDRSLKLWDLRSVSKSNSHSEILDGLSSPVSYGLFSSRLSISNVDWNSNQRLVCNGYDDKLRLFDISSEKFTQQDSGKRNRNRNKSVPSSELQVMEEVFHNCQTGRWVSILKSRWQRQPADGLQKFAIGNMNRSIDIYAEDGQHMANLAAPDMTAVPAVVSFHPTKNWVMGGTSSGKVFLFN